MGKEEALEIVCGLVLIEKKQQKEKAFLLSEASCFKGISLAVTLLSDWLHITFNKLHTGLSSEHSTYCDIRPRQFNMLDISDLWSEKSQCPSEQNTPHTAGRAVRIILRAITIIEAFLRLSDGENKSKIGFKILLYEPSMEGFWIYYWLGFRVSQPIHFTQLSWSKREKEN